MKKIHNNLTIENLVRTDWINQFNEKQQKEILANLDVSDTINLLKSNKISRIYITFLHLYFK